MFQRHSLSFVSVRYDEMQNNVDYFRLYFARASERRMDKK